MIALDADPGQGANLAVWIDRSASSYGDIVRQGPVRYPMFGHGWGTTQLGLMFYLRQHNGLRLRAVITGELWL